MSLPAQITPDLARSCADKMNLLLQVQLLGQSVTDVPSALRLLVDLARELVPYDRALLLWAEEPDGPFQVRVAHGFEGPPPLSLLQERLVPREPLGRPRPILVSPRACPNPSVRALLEKLGATSVLSMPLYVGQRVMGELVLFREHVGPFRVEEAHLIRVFTFTFESFLENLLRSRQPSELAFLDRLTGLFNRKYFEQQLEREMDRARRNSEPVSVLMVDVEGFAAFRERHGHATGEALLQEVARALRQVCRKSDTLARYQDDHFAAILPRTGKESLGIVAQRAFTALEGAFLAGVLGEAGRNVEFNICAVAYPDDAFSPEAAVEACYRGLEKARTMPGRHYFQFPSAGPQGDEGDLLDTARVDLFREPLLDPSRLLRLFARLCLDTVPAERVSIMVREGDELVIQVAFGFEGQEEIVRTSRVPLNRQTVSAWVAQRREPLLVTGNEDLADLPLNRSATYTTDSFFSYPLLENGELIGVIHFSNRADGQPFTWEDVDRFAPLAKLISGYLVVGNRFGSVQEQFLRDSLFALVDLMESQVPGMEGHSREVARLVEATARDLGYPEEEMERLRVTSMLHDLGKVSYRTRILSEPRALSPRERALTQRHPLLGWKFLEGVPLRKVDRDAILYHHEREDGSGYLHKPGEDIPLTAKLLAVADVYQALTSPRPYRPAISEAEALEYLESHKGILFDPRVVDAFRLTVRREAASA
ncbi:MAG: hypothetical protein Kow0092_09110 [Deferrisomatales bacterium]